MYAAMMPYLHVLSLPCSYLARLCLFVLKLKQCFECGRQNPQWASGAFYMAISRFPWLFPSPLLLFRLIHEVVIVFVSQLWLTDLSGLLWQASWTRCAFEVRFRPFLLLFWVCMTLNLLFEVL